MQAEFEMSLMQELKYCLGIQIHQTSEATYIHQNKYTKEILKKFNMSEFKLVKTHMHPTCIQQKGDVSSKVFQKLCCVMIGSLLYLNAFRPDIIFSVCLCAHFQSVQGKLI